jgi:uncharacterized membrane protein YfhO
MLNEVRNRRLNSNPNRNHIYIIVIICLFSVFAILLVLFKVIGSAINNSNNFHSLFFIYLLVSISSIGLYSIFLHRANPFKNIRWLSIIVIFEIIVGVYMYISPPQALLISAFQQDSTFVSASNEQKNELGVLPSRIDRIKNICHTSSSNYPFILERAALSNWTHSISGNLQDSIKLLGYSTIYTRLSDFGGTVFSDALLNIKQTISTDELDKDLYTQTNRNHSYILYTNKYNLPFGLTMSSSDASLIKPNANCFEYQNAFFECLSGQKDLISSIKSDLMIDNTVITNASAREVGLKNEYFYQCKIVGSHVLYFYSTDNNTKLSFYIDGKSVSITSLGQKENKMFPVDYNNNLLCLGTFTDQVTNIRIVCPPSFSEVDIQLGLLDLKKLESLTHNYENYTVNETSNKRSISLTVNGNAEKDMLFLPISYDSGWRCSVNEQAVNVEKVANSFLGIKLQNGENNVNLVFFPSGMKIGLCISFLTLLILVIGFIISRKHMLKIPEIALRCFEIAFFMIWGCVITMFYIVPTGYTIIHSILKQF